MGEGGRVTHEREEGCTLHMRDGGRGEGGHMWDGGGGKGDT